MISRALVSRAGFWARFGETDAALGFFTSGESMTVASESAWPLALPFGLPLGLAFGLAFGLALSFGALGGALGGALWGALWGALGDALGDALGGALGGALGFFSALSVGMPMPLEALGPVSVRGMIGDIEPFVIRCAFAARGGEMNGLWRRWSGPCSVFPYCESIFSTI